MTPPDEEVADEMKDFVKEMGSSEPGFDRPYMGGIRFEGVKDESVFWR